MRPIKGTRSIFTIVTNDTSYVVPAGVLEAYRNQVLQWFVTLNFQTVANLRPQEWLHQRLYSLLPIIERSKK
jgi:ribosomal protein L11 methylase PrmA